MEFIASLAVLYVASGGGGIKLEVSAVGGCVGATNGSDNDGDNGGDNGGDNDGDDGRECTGWQCDDILSS
jgi:hypothetical protein